MACKECDTLTLLSYTAGDLSVNRHAEVQRHLGHCPDCSRTVAEMEKERAAFLAAYPEAPPVSATGTIVRFRPLATLLPVAAVLVIAFGIGSLVRRQPASVWRTKGEVGLSLYVSDSTGKPDVPEDSVFYPGERIQFTYSCGTERYFILVSIDENGKVSVFYPVSGDSSMAVEPGNDLPLPHSIRLDGYIGRERYVAVFSEQPLAVAQVTETVSGSVAHTGSFASVPIVIPDAKVRSVVIDKREAGKR